ncbi:MULTISPECIES: DUF86 domain-containing protein [unclassified Actinomyces]|uniref:DUF86 domain-containing protein n=1 Tax=Actinomyces glycerinitolerans TaxID=1892869 RepID=A0A1M4RX25_9ACTO|nr:MULTISPECIES: HepT-like ribonuclease domain-containing protein [unclassified Actinomyces]RAX21058.1 DUF86 domain-containing protein [Actinomyces sp. Z3]RAX21552.1 DUF86 domain-containing protein [Actinomyces sp. Z5]SHE24450.1 Hypothetical protein ACGLYG10_0651 [Actinomyces glycerinitolerans]
MTPTSRTPLELIDEALYHFEAAQAYAQRDITDPMTLDAISLRLAAGIEAFGALPPRLRDEAAQGEWHLLRGMRNRIAHGYLQVDPTIVSATVQRDVPALVATLRSLHQRLSSN